MLPTDSGPFGKPKKAYQTPKPGRSDFRRPRRPRVTSSAPRYSTPSLSRGYNSGGGGSSSRIAKAPKPKPPPSLSQYLARDADYQDQLRSYARSFSDFTADVGRRKTKLTGDYNAGVKSMGDQRVKDLQDIMNDFASRGLLQSGLYGQRESDYEKQYQSNLSDLGRQQKSNLGDISAEQTQFTRQQQLEKESARKDAARRRAEKYGI